MRMKIIDSEKKLCSCCMEEHEVNIVKVKENTSYKGRDVTYDAFYTYCENADELYMDEQQIRENDIRLKDSYREAEGLLTSHAISAIRAKYGISQSDFCILLGWGGKTITRYESHQIQDRAHDTILKKVDHDPEWFLCLLNDAKGNISEVSYHKYSSSASRLYEASMDLYLRKAIEAKYAKFLGNAMYHGNTELSLDKVIDMIRYYAASKGVSNLYKVKLMKLMWYADALSYKQRGSAITGLVYQALPMGAVPIGHNVIITLKGVPCEEIDMGDVNAYHFSLTEECNYPSLSEEDKSIMDMVICKLGKMTKDEIVSTMHNELAYIKTAPREIIEFKYAENLMI
ncbi:MAG: DUF4065 domain-containing protein [Clostridiales bacterium]|nr:DUF4065 domain-containing protein [Clostridiales bacterium]